MATVIIQNRRGSYNDFDPQKLKPGEFAIVQSNDPNSSDGRAVYICTQAGTVKRLATITDIMDEVQNATETIIEQIEDAVADDVERAENAAESVEQSAAQIATNTADIADLKSDLNDLEEYVESISGLSDEAKAALLACFAHVAWIGDDGQDYYDALEEALEVTPSLRPLYSLPEITIFTGSNDIDTNVELEWGKVYTLFLEYSASTIDSNIRGVICAINSSNTDYQAIQVKNHWNTGNKTVWGMALTQPGDAGATNAGIGALARHVIILDCTGETVSGKIVITHHYKNISNDAWSGDYSSNTVTQQSLESYGALTIASSTHSNIYNFIGMVSGFDIYDRLMSSDAIQNFLTNGPKRPTDSTLVYALPQPTTFDGTNYIDTEFTLSEGGVWTIMLEYEPSEISSASPVSGNYPINYVLSNMKADSSDYLAIQLSKAYISSTYQPIVWGAGLGWQSTTSNIAVNNIVRHVLVIDTREGATESGKFLLKHYFKNSTKGITNSNTLSYDLTTLRTDTSFLIGFTRSENTNHIKYKGRVTTCRIVARELSADDITLFTTYGRW